MPYIKVEAHNPQGPFWQGYEWSAWVDLNAARPERAQGIYRVRCQRRRGLLYIGISGNLSARSGKLRRGVIEQRPGHPASQCVREQRCHPQISWVVLTREAVGVGRRELYGIEAELIAAYRAAFHESPDCQWSGRERREAE